MEYSPSVSIEYLLGDNGTTGVTLISLLEDIAEGPRTLDSLAKEYGIDKTTVYRSLSPAAEDHLVETVDTEYRLTGFGAVVAHQFAAACDRYSISSADLTTLSRSAHKRWILDQLADTPQNKADLARGEGAPSRSTVHRAIETFQDHRWVTRNENGDFCLTDRGTTIGEAYADLEAALEAANSRAVFLASLDARIADIPPIGLANSQLIVETNLSTGNTEAALEELVEQVPDDVRTLQSSVSTRLADIYEPVIRSPARTQILVTERVLSQLPTEGRYSDHVRRGLTSKNVSVRVVSDIPGFPLNMAIHDGETVVMGPPDTSCFVEHNGSLLTGAIVSTDETLVEWAQQLWDSYHQQSVSIGEQVLTSILSRIRATVSRKPETTNRPKDV